MSYLYIEAPNYIPMDAKQPSLFLGGGITGCEDWQAKAIKKLCGLDNITICNPRRENFDMNASWAESQAQIAWEHHYLDICSQVLFWFSGETIQPIVLFELGARLRQNRLMPNKQQIFIGYHPDYSRKLDVVEQVKLEGYTYPLRTNLDDLLSDVVNYNHLVPLFG